MRQIINILAIISISLVAFSTTRSDREIPLILRCSKKGVIQYTEKGKKELLDGPEIFINLEKNWPELLTTSQIYNV